jgi:hypothetical protein
MPVFEVGPAPAFAAAVTLCGLEAKLADECADERGLRATGSRLLSAFVRPGFERARAFLASTDFAVAEVWRQLVGQSRIEQQVLAGGDPALAAQPSARAFAAIVMHTAQLAGKDANVAPLAAVGRSLGELIYTLDAFQDWDRDLRRGRFNYLAALAGLHRHQNQEQARRRARELVLACQEQLRSAWRQVELRRYRSVLDAVLLTGLPITVERVLAPSSGRSDDAGFWIHAARRKADATAQDASCCDQCNYGVCPSGDCSGCSECCSHGCCCDGDCSGCDCGNCDCSGCDCGGCSS